MMLSLVLQSQHIYPWGWRLSLALAGVPGLMLFIGALVLPDTPNSLIERGKSRCLNVSGFWAARIRMMCSTT
jgi:hypothetical protein